MDMESGSKGQKEHVRTIALLGSGVVITIKIADWEKAGDDAFAKEFDEKNTAILRVWKERNGAGFMIYGMKASRAKGGGKAADDTVTEAYEIVSLEGMVANAVDQIASHCGLDGAFRKQVSI